MHCEETLFGSFLWKMDLLWDVGVGKYISYLILSEKKIWCMLGNLYLSIFLKVEQIFWTFKKMSKILILNFVMLFESIPVLYYPAKSCCFLE